MYEVIIEYDNQGPRVVMRSHDLAKCLDKQKRLIKDGHLDCFISRGKPGFPGPLDSFEAKVKV